MSSYQVAVVTDGSAPSTGTAIVRIAGLKSWPENATVRLIPIDDAVVPANSAGWPWDPITPLDVTITDKGVDIVLGPDVVASPRLLPGTPLTIKIGAANLEVEARWPAVAPLQRRRTGAVAMSASQLLAAKAEREQAERQAATRRQELAEIAVKSARDAANNLESAETPDASHAERLRIGEPSQLARMLPIRRQETLSQSSRVDPNAKSSNAAGSVGQLARLGPAPAANVVPMPSTPLSGARRANWGLRGFVAGLVTMAGIAGLIANLSPLPWGRGLTAGAPAGTVGDQIAAADLQAIFKDIATTGTQSPHNKSAANVDVATALSLADHSLRGQRSQGETGEAEFWLKRALAASMGGQEVGWALTQLGTIYATAGTPNHSYVKAHALWELAVAQGDPVAHCFLGALYEHGLGVAKSKHAAREHYLTADSLGACRSAKDAAARLSE